MKDMYYVAVYEVNGLVEAYHSNTNSPFYKQALVCMHDLENAGAKLLSCFATNDVVLYFKARLKAQLLELRSLVDHNREQIRVFGSSLTREEILSFQAVEQNQMFKVATTTEELFERDIDVMDELAVECFNYKQQLDSRF